MPNPKVSDAYQAAYPLPAGWDKNIGSMLNKTPNPNPSGISPTEFKVLVEPKAVEEKTAGGIILPDQKKESDKYATTEGRIVAVAPLAFTYAREEEWEGQPKPAVGDWVIFAKYAGLRVTGNDGKDYLLLNDKDIAASRKQG